MTRLLVLVVAAAVVVPTAVLGGGTTLASQPLALYSVKQVERAFAAQGIALRVHSSHPGAVREVDLVRSGPEPESFQPRVRVLIIPKHFSRTGTGRGRGVYFTTFAVGSSGSDRSTPRYTVFGGSGNITVSWSTNRRWRQQAALVHAALARLRSPGSGTIYFRCIDVGSALKQLQAETRAEAKGLPTTLSSPFAGYSCGTYP